MDKELTSRFSAFLVAHRDELIKQWCAVVAKTLRGRQSETELTRQTVEIFSALLIAVESGEHALSTSESTELRAVLSELSQSRARHGFTVTETAISVFALKDALLAVQGGTMKADALKDYIAYAKIIDDLGLFTVETFVKAREELIADQSEQLLELSTPVVKLWDGVIGVPLVGTLDSARAQVVMERMLQALVDTASPFAIIDITGVPAVDTQVAQHILKTVVAARLMGADCIISGIRPQIAQTIVALGIEFGDIVTKSSLADALSHALRASGVDLARRNHRPAI